MSDPVARKTQTHLLQKTTMSPAMNNGGSLVSSKMMELTSPVRSPGKTNKASSKYQNSSQRPGLSPTQQDSTSGVPNDDAERAFFELQDAKVNFFNEKTEYEEKMQQRKI